MKFVGILFLSCFYVALIEAQDDFSTFFGFKINDITITDKVQPSVVNETYPKLRIYYSNGNYVDATYVTLTNLGNLYSIITDRSNQNNLPFILFSYGWQDNAITSKDTSGTIVANAMAISYLAYRYPFLGYANVKSFNFIGIEWNAYNQGEYLSVLETLPLIANAIGDQLTQMASTNNNPIDLTNWHFVGHSLGAHLVGLIARRIKSNSGGKMIISRITALDPAGPFINYPVLSLFIPHLEKSDAKFVDVIHSDPVCFGSSWSLGHMDFWPNAAQPNQPGCPRIDTFDYVFHGKNVCSHKRAYELYAASVFIGRRDFKTLFPSVRCVKNFFGKLECTNDIAYMGYSLDITGKEGDYYLITNSSFPYDLGMNGISVYQKHGEVPGDELSFQ